MELQIPDWLNEKFLQEILQKESSASVIKFSVESAVAAGVNYTSYLYRVLVECTVDESSHQSSVSLIVKTPAEAGFLKGVWEKTGGYIKEPLVYGILLPKLLSKTNIEFGPKSYFCPVKDTIVLKDLNSEGFSLCDKFQQLDYPHCKYALMTLAKFHAASVACCREDPTLAEFIGKERLYTNDGPCREEIRSLVFSGVNNMLETLTKHDIDELKTSCDFVSRRIEGIWESIVDKCTPKPGNFNVLNHGDCWINNMLFKHNASGTIIDLKFIDFQNCRYGSPLFYITFFIWTSANEEVRENRLQELYGDYLETLNQTLAGLGCEEKFTSEKFKESFESSTDWILLITSLILPFVLFDPDSAIEVEGNEDLIKYYKSREYTAKLPVYFKQILNIFHPSKDKTV